MPYYRKRNGYRKSYKKRYGNRYIKGRLKKWKRKISPNLYRFTRWTESSNIVVDSTGDLSVAYTFKLSDLPNYSEFTGLYDQYRIKAVRYQILWQQQELLPSTTASYIGTVLHAIDLDDATSPASANEMYQYKYLKIGKSIGMTKRYLKPRTLTTMYNNGVTSAYSLQNRKAWLDAAYPDIQHFGLKLYIQRPSGTTEIAGVVKMKYYLEFRNPR